MKFNDFLRLAAVLILVAVSPLSAQRLAPPPPFPGAAPDSAAAEELGDPGQGQEIRAYSTTASIEEVFRYYKSQLSATPTPDNPVDPSNLRNGSSTPAFFDLSFYDSLPAQQATAMKSKRKPYDNGKWIQNASFNWAIKEGTNKFTSHSIQLEDRSFDEEGYAPKTVIVVQRESGGISGEPDEADSDEPREQRSKARGQQAPVAPPSAQELGAPLYPGAVFNAEATSSFAASGIKSYIYLSTDQPDKVASFYSSSLGIQPTKDSDGRYMIPLKGKLPLPDWGIEILPNRVFDQKFKTVITFASWTPFNSGQDEGE